MNILLTSAGQRVSLVRAFQKEIKKISETAKVYTVDLNPILAPACHVSDGYDSITKVTDENYIQDLLEICLKRRIKLIIPTIDTELLILSENKDLFIQNGIIPIVSDFKFIQKCRDKRISNEFFLENGIDIPKAIDKNRPSFPLFIKPYDGSLSRDIFVVKNDSELTEYHLSNSKLMFMEYIDNLENDEYTVDAYYDKNNELKCVVPRKRIFVRSGEINKGVTQKNEIKTFVKSKLSKIEGAIGCLTMQFFFNPITKRIIGIEINPRFGGGYPLSYLAGANFPQWLIKEYLLHEDIPYFKGWENNLLMLRYDDEILVHNYEV
ncbi:ATP-grasp domain-containing protein [Flavobacterium bomense]|uniref:ATP-grasp domain-containing protein n=1 Tax=Flavobacterium bomense TaxID=2497483 RepID=A0A3S0MEV9_9FLAO|nr:MULTISPECIES: ATP-grasp domain-containing protein [Flavobacterium]RTY66253.1 ATP-grasp domain-containing protein [Flavobacterium sp. LB2P53]RTZ05519.1 ATP-grasp domain-containing protein [Flavobacterium bomense]